MTRRSVVRDGRLLGPLTLRVGVLLVFSSALISFLDVPLRGDAAPYGIVSFELAASPRRALAILLQWQNDAALGHAKLIQIVDFLYLLIYGGFFALLALFVGSRLDEPVWSVRAAWASVTAAFFDVLENVVLLLEIVRVDSPPPYPQLGAAFAIAKFTLLGLAILYSIVAGAMLVVRRYRRPL